MRLPNHSYSNASCTERLVLSTLHYSMNLLIGAHIGVDLFIIFDT